jgi:uncharacterized membrane protein
VVICLVKGIAAGVVPGLLYKLIEKKNKLVGVILASAAAPIMNTGLFILGALCFLQEAIMLSPVDVTGFTGETIGYYLIVIVAGINFLVEFAINLVLSPAIHRVVLVVGKMFHKSKTTKTQSCENEIPAEADPSVNMIEEDIQTVDDVPTAEVEKEE